MRNLDLKRQTDRDIARRRRRELRDEAFGKIGRKCIFCKTGELLHAAHVIPTALRGPSRGLDRRFRDVIKNPDCYRPICKRCHWIFDQLVKLVRPLEPEPPDEPIPD